MKKPKPIHSPQIRPGYMKADIGQDHLVTADQASAALNLPLYFFIDARKRAALGIPYYSINRMVRYRIRELHKWQVRYAAELNLQAQTSQTGGVHA